MGFIDDLKKGLPGLRLAVPDTWQRHEEEPQRAVLVDNEHRVGWHLLHAPFCLDLRPEFDEVLRRDVERHARQGFEAQYAQLQPPAEYLAQRPPLRTTDPSWPGWSPIVEMRRVDLGGAPALLVIRRAAYEPILEVVLGHLLIPLASGLCDITVFHRTAETGYRESYLLNLAIQQHPGEDPPRLARRLGQAYFDDPRQDAHFPKHPLTSVRAALRWLMEQAGPAGQAAPGASSGLIQVIAPMPRPAAPGEVELPAAGSAITPPPRYLLMPPGRVPLPRTMSILTRVLLEGGETPRTLDIWQLESTISDKDSKVRPDREEELLSVARQNAAELEKRGTGLEAQFATLSAQGDRVLCSSQIRLQVAGHPTQSAVRWIGDGDGQVFRLAITAPGYLPAEELAGEVDAVLNSWRRIHSARSAPRNAWLTSDLSLLPKAPAKT